MIASVLAMGGCGDSSTHQAQHEVRDSAGVEVVLNHTPAWNEEEGWSVELQPVVSIGSVDGTAEETFTKIRGAMLASDGSIIVADEGSYSVRIFEPNGSWFSTVGRQGQGPGEFGWIWIAGQLPGDSLWVYDYENARISVFEPGSDFDFARSVSVTEARMRNYWVLGAFEDGSFLMVSPGRAAIEGASGRFLDSIPIVALHSSGDRLDTLPAYSITTREVGDNGLAGRVTMSPTTWATAVGDRAYLTHGELLEYRVVRRSGELVRIVRGPGGPVEMTDSVRTAYIEAAVQLVSEGDGGHETDPEVVRRTMEEGSWSGVQPVVGGIIVDDENHVWLGRYAGFNSTPTVWEVFSPQGRWLGSVETPHGVDIKDISSDQILGVFTDEVGVQYIHVYKLLRHGEAEAL